MNVLHFRKELSQPPVAANVAGIEVRPVVVPEDVPVWLALRARAMDGLKPAVRVWQRADFFAEIVGQPPRLSRTLVAAPTDAEPAIVGSVTLALRGDSTNRVPVVHWLLVDPSWRRRGVGRLLLSKLESAAWNDGWREVQLETHASWAAAVAFYQSMGYAPLRDPSER